MVSKKRDFVHGESFANGIMMNNDNMISIAIRKKDGNIGEVVKTRLSLTKKHWIFNLFVIRGIIKFFEGTFNQFYAEEQMKKIESNKNKIKKATELNDTLVPKLLVFLTLFAGIIIYFIIPTIIAFFLKQIILNILLLNLIEGIIRLVVFILLFCLFSSLERVNETPLYHGAEHKFLLSYKMGEDLTLENARKHPIFHPGCGTSVLLFMIIISIPIFLFLNYENLLFRIIIMLILLPLIIGVAFEITIWLDKSQSKLARIISMPGLFLQRFNTKEPDDNYLNVALVSLKNLINY